MGYAIYVNRKKASENGIEARLLGEHTISQSYIDEDGWEVYVEPLIIPIYGIYVDGVRVECSNIYVDNQYIGWKEGPTFEARTRVGEKHFTESW